MQRLGNLGKISPLELPFNSSDADRCFTIALATKARIQTNSFRAVYDEKRNSVLVPDPAVRFLCLGVGRNVANVDNWYCGSRPLKRIHALKTARGLSGFAKEVPIVHNTVEVASVFRQVVLGFSIPQFVEKFSDCHP